MKIAIKLSLLLCILFSFHFATADESKFTVSCTVRYSHIQATGEVVEGSGEWGPPIEKVGYRQQTLNFKGFSIEVMVNPICSTVYSEDFRYCSPSSLHVSVTKGDSKATGAVDMGTLSTRESRHVGALKKGIEELSVVCRMRKQEAPPMTVIPD